ncbi:MAG: phosphate acyltransferase PlsX [Tissierellia bacterium]|nr:phosphate acyltransferase PlsX [Tissierellia bacterium]
MRLLIDTLGADKGAEEIVKGCVEAYDVKPYEMILVGDPDQIMGAIPEGFKGKPDLRIIETKDYIENTDEPALAIRRRKEASMVMGFRALKAGEADGMLSAGSTGALLAGGTLIIGRIPKVERAALTIISPGVDKPTIVLDVGANMDCTPNLLRQFALMGSIYAKSVFHVDRPKVGLLNIGAEKGKGNQLTKEAYDLLEQAQIQFVGNVEPRDILTTDAHVVVCDGFAGNVLLKSMEGTAQVMLGLLKDAIYSSTRAKLGGILVKPALSGLKQKLDYREYGAAPLLGTKQPVFKAHGSSDHIAIRNGLLAMMRFIEGDVLTEITTQMGGESDERTENS